MAAVILSEAVVRPGVCSLPSSSASSPRPPLFASFGNSSLRSSREARLAQALFFHHKLPDHRIPVRSTSLTTNASASRNGVYTVGDFMTNRGNLHVVKPTTGVDEALELLVEKRITGFPVIDDDWNLVGVVSDYDLLALDSISGGGGKPEINLFPEVNSTWKTFNKIQRLLSKTNGKVVGDVMTPAPLVVRETTNLEDAARLLLETKYRRLPVVDANGKLVGMITRGNVVRAALQLKHESENVN